MSDDPKLRRSINEHADALRHGPLLSELPTLAELTARDPQPEIDRIAALLMERAPLLDQFPWPAPKRVSWWRHWPRTAWFRLVCAWEVLRYGPDHREDDDW